MVLRRPIESALGSAVAMVNQAALMGRATIVDGLLQRIQHELGMR
jgi:hypothetical protein